MVAFYLSRSDDTTSLTVRAAPVQVTRALRRPNGLTPPFLRPLARDACMTSGERLGIRRRSALRTRRVRALRIRRGDTRLHIQACSHWYAPCPRQSVRTSAPAAARNGTANEPRSRTINRGTGHDLAVPVALQGTTRPRHAVPGVRAPVHVTIPGARTERPGARTERPGARHACTTSTEIVRRPRRSTPFDAPHASRAGLSNSAGLHAPRHSRHRHSSCYDWALGRPGFSTLDCRTATG